MILFVVLVHVLKKYRHIRPPSRHRHSRSRPGIYICLSMGNLIELIEA
jgi:hypothetical protein